VLDHLAQDADWPYSGNPCWVLSSRELAVPTGEGIDVRIVNANVADIYDELLAAAGERNLWIGGGGNVASQIADEGLLDEVLVTVVPVVLGVGSPVRPSTSRDAGVARLIAEDPELLQLVSAEGHLLRGRVPARSGLLALLRRRRAGRRRLSSWLAQLVRAAKDRGRGRSL
jgi:RibD C-terminal domain